MAVLVNRSQNLSRQLAKIGRGDDLKRAVFIDIGKKEIEPATKF